MTSSATPGASSPVPPSFGRDIALVGMACMFSGSENVRRYWENICRRVDAVREVPPERWRIEDFYSEDRFARDRVYSRWGGFLDKVFFDPVKWRIPPASLRHIEPMQLLSLEIAWQAMVDAGFDPQSALGNSQWRERAGVLFAVPGSHELGTAYCFRTMMRHYLPKVEGLPEQVREHIYTSLEGQLPEWTEDSFPGFLGNVVAGRIAREFDFNGPNFTVDAACAASLAALFTAVEMLRSGTADLMLVGGADGTNNPFGYMSFAKTHALSPRGRSRAFDDSGDGIALGEGVAAVVLKRLADAERDGDKIYAVIKGVGCSSDGKNRSLTAPHPPGQSRAVNRAYEDAGISPASVTLIEAHGTGTAVGDSAELNTLSRVFAPHTDERQYVAVGSVKSMIGHTKTVAGLASLIKSALALQQRVLPPTIGIETPNRTIDLAQSPFYLNTETRPWMEEKGEQPRRAAVSSFGFGGTNFHVVLEEYDGPSVGPASQAGQPNWTPRAAELFVFQRASRAELMSDLQQFQEQLGEAATDDLAGLAAAVFTAESKRTRSSGGSRLALVAASVEDLRQKIHKALALLPERAELNDPSGIYHSEAPAVPASQVCFLYPGQGSQSVNMLRDLSSSCRWCHDLFLEANRLLKEELPRPLTRYIYPPPVFDEAEREQQRTALQDTRVAQPALGVVELFATDLLERFGVRPAFVAGHSYGEHVALQVAGCLSRADLLNVSAQRGRVCADAARACPGAMASVQGDPAVTEAALRELNIPARLANLNAPEQTVIAGPVEAIAAAVEQLPRRGLRTRKLAVSAAFHTPQLSAAAATMRDFLAGVSFQRPALPVYSNTTGARHADEPESIRVLLARHFSEPVLFEKEIRQLHADGARLFIEVGPGKVLTDLVGRILQGEPATALSLDAPGRDGWTQLGHLIGRLSALGLPVNVAAWFADRGLEDNSVAEFLERARTRNTPRATDWVLSPNKAEPVTPLPKRPDLDSTVTAPAVPPAAVPRSPVPNGRGQSTIPASSKSEKVPAAMTITNGEPRAAGNDLFAQFQATTRLLLEAQQSQNRVLERYLEMQERLMLHFGQGAPMPPTSFVPPPTLAEPRPPIAEAAPPPLTPRVRPTSAVTRPPVVIPRAAAVTPPRPAPVPAAVNGNGTNGTHTVAAEKAAPVNGQPTPTPTPAVNGEGPPPTEIFRRDLLDVVSVRTGYPIDALDENLALESELGIDSIKTVEIFSQLKTYHVFFRAEDQEEEELLAEFTKLKTLRDIIESYDRRRQTVVAAPHNNGAATPKVNGDDKVNGSVKHYAVASVAAPMEINGLKKNGFLTETSSS
ncbi:MAG TPA: beta-ketoacyl synthase N-terminal-like domain-containing protein [Gemmataceae bacterium]